MKTYAVQSRLTVARASKAFLTIGSLLLIPLLSNAATITWTKAGDGSWETPGSWSSGSVPGSGDDAVIATAVKVTATSVNGTVNSISITNTSATLSMEGGILSFAANSSIAGTLNISSSDSTIGCSSGTLTLTGNTAWSNGTIKNVTNNGAMTLSGTATKTLIGTLNNNGTITHGGTGNLAMNWGSVFNNKSGATFDIQADVGITAGGGGGAWPQVNNDGTFKKTAGTGTSSIQEPFNNGTNGAITVQTGTLTLAAGGTSTGGAYTVASEATLDLTGTSTTHGYSGTYTGSGAGTVLLDVGTITINSTGATFNFPAGLFQWKSGTLTCTQTLTNSGYINISGTSDKTLGATLNNTGTIIQTGTGNFLMAWGSVLNNKSAGTYEFQSDAGIAAGGGGGAWPQINNEGTFKKTGGTGTTNIQEPYNNSSTGSIVVQSGTLTLSAGGTSTGGTYTISSGATLNLAGGSDSHTFTGTYTGSGSGTVLVDSGKISAGAGGFTFNFPQGLFSWQGGTLYASSTNTLTNSGYIALSGASTKIIAGTLNNNGTITQSGAGNLGMWAGCIFNNNSGGVYEIQSDSGIVSGGGGGAWPTINNAGTLKKTGGTGTSTIIYSYSSTGTTQATSGTLTFSETIGQISSNKLTAGKWYAEGGALSFTKSGNSITTNAAEIKLSGSTAAFSNISGLSSNTGTLTVTSGCNFTTSAALSNTGTIAVGSSSTLTVTGNYTQSAAATLSTDITDAQSTGKYGKLTATGAATLDGTLTINRSTSYEPTVGDTYDIINYGSYSGSFATTNGLTIANHKLFKALPSSTTYYLQTAWEQFTITASAGSNGSISPSGSSSVDYGTSKTYTMTPSANYHVADVLVDGGSAGAVTTYTFSSVSASHTIAVTFTHDTAVLTMAASPSTGGATSPTVGQSTVNTATAQAITATVATGYVFINWTATANATIASAASASTTATLTGDATVTANFLKTATMTMAVSPDACGTTTPSAGQSTTVTTTIPQAITATAATGYAFYKWTAAANATFADAASASTTATLAGDATITANFLKTATMTMAISPSGSGTTSPTVGQSTVSTTIPLAITATAGSDYKFANWTATSNATVADAASAGTTATLTGDATVTANFQKIKCYMTMAVSPDACGTTTPSAGKSYVSVGQSQAITATAASGYFFTTWSCTAKATVASPASASTTAVLSDDATITANFIPMSSTAQLTMAVSPASTGTTTPAGVTTVAKATSVAITAAPAENYRFVNWTATGSAAIESSSSASTNAVLTGDATLTAYFAVKVAQATLTMAASPSGSGTTTPVTGSQTLVDTEKEQAIAAVAATGYAFKGWTVSPNSAGSFADSTKADTTVTLLASGAVTANFQKEKYITVTVPSGGEQWQVGTTRTIVWTSSGVTGNVAIALYKSGKFDSDIVTETANTGAYDWSIPLVTNNTSARARKRLGATVGSFYKIRISSVDDPTLYGESANYFSITLTDKTITLTNPIGGEAWTLASTQSIAWINTGTIDAVQIDIYKGGVLAQSIPSVANVNSYDWPIPGTFTAGTDYTIKVSDASIATICGHSGKFAVTSSGATANLTMALTPEATGSVSPETGGHEVNTNEAVQITAEATTGYKFQYWTVSSASGAVADVKSATTTVTLTGDATVTAVFALSQSGFEPITSSTKIKIQLDNIKANKDSVSISNASLPGDTPKPAQGASISFRLDNYYLDMTSGTWKTSGDKITITGQDANKNEKYSLSMDFKTGKMTWTFKLSKASMAGLLDSFDGLDIALDIGGVILGQNIDVDESISWKYDSAKNGAGTPLDLTGEPWRNFGVQKADGKLNTTKSFSDQFTVGKGLGDALADTDPASSTVVLSIDEWSLDLDNSESGGWKTSGSKHTFKGTFDGVTTLELVLDFTTGKSFWKAKVTKADFFGQIDGKDGLDVRLIVGDYEGGVQLPAAQTTTLTFPLKL